MGVGKKGELVRDDKDKGVLRVMKVENVVEKEFVGVDGEMDVGELVKGMWG